MKKILFDILLRQGLTTLAGITSPNNSGIYLILIA